MAEGKKKDFQTSAHILDNEDEKTLTILKQRVKSADQGRLVTSKEVRKQMNKWLATNECDQKRIRFEIRCFENDYECCT